MTPRAILQVTMAAILTLGAAGCQLSDVAGQGSRPIEYDPLDPVAQRMHDMCGKILAFHMAYSRLPSSVRELCSITAMDVEDTIDPDTGEPFEYRSDGFATVSEAGSVISMASPSENGSRWCIVFDEGTTSTTCRVVRLPASALDATYRSTHTR